MAHRPKVDHNTQHLTHQHANAPFQSMLKAALTLSMEEPDTEVLEQNSGFILIKKVKVIDRMLAAMAKIPERISYEQHWTIDRKGETFHVGAHVDFDIYAIKFKTQFAGDSVTKVVTVHSVVELSGLDKNVVLRDIVKGVIVGEFRNDRRKEVAKMRAIEV
jgi:hypothetical protein